MSEEINNVEATVEGPKVDETKLKLAEDELNSFKTELKTKLYALKVTDIDTVNDLLSFVTEEAEWKGMEALGIEELSKSLAKVVEAGEIKSGCVFLKNLEVEALHYFLGKSSGTGKESADAFLRRIRIVNEAIKMVKADNNKVNILESKVESIRCGIEVEMPIEQKETADA